MTSSEPQEVIVHCVAFTWGQWLAENEGTSKEEWLAVLPHNGIFVSPDGNWVWIYIRSARRPCGAEDWHVEENPHGVVDN